MGAKSLQSCLSLCDPMDCSPSGSSVHGLLQTRILEWGAMPSSRGSSQPRDWTSVSYVFHVGRRSFFFLLAPPGKSIVKSTTDVKKWFWVTSFPFRLSGLEGMLRLPWRWWLLFSELLEPSFLIHFLIVLANMWVFFFWGGGHKMTTFSGDQKPFFFFF